MNKRPRRSPNASGAAPPGRVRLIGGRWRGTRLDVPDRPGLRPTADRVRETLFNWLMPVLPGARVLDLFAGSGALGLEALSRGAAEAVLVERDPALAANLRALAARLPGGEAARVVEADALAWLARQPAAEFDLAFVDPPFAAGLWDAALAALPARLKPDAWLYLEAPHGAGPALAPEWRLHREGHTREVRYALYRRSPSAAATLPASPASGRPVHPTDE
ncbi:16S rRNA (guanine(966)-N(2))-methyltransferase RsmD [Vulcaniibacterium tengchongense]|uniref:Ribosomal RNA small subunit methyltransferase D n=1 Tax=Vulcaniibacterium tengchongense TaxID=1273429 RepID=A0A3N4VBU8_9GAMM|nr:16S rRNA (guanine(966)-N(2))-methyltransferase RsmD [Vulcaniibacterium tengchongense]RPE77099.1 16S rRNA m(2)G-966 methyltransferase [Vulcaniibacterium tengchongense]